MNFILFDDDAYQSNEDSIIAIVLAADVALPSQEEIGHLLKISENASKRGYFTPTEDEGLRETYARYLAIRSSLWQVIQTMPDQVVKLHGNPDQATVKDWRLFSIAFCASELNVRTSEFLIDLARERPDIWHKLNEADVR